MLVPLFYFKPFMRRLTFYPGYGRFVLFNSRPRPSCCPSFQALSFSLNRKPTTLNTSLLLGFHPYSLKTIALDLNESKKSFDCKQCRCQSSFDVKSLWNEEKLERKSKLVINKPTSRPYKENHPIAVESKNGLRFASSIQEELLNSALEKADGPNNINIGLDWNNIKNSILEINGSIDEENIDAIIMKKCCDMKSFRLGKSFFKHLKLSNTQINRASYGNYLLLFYNCSSECTEEDLKEIYNIYEEIQHIYRVIDSTTAEKVILALSVTKHWKEYIKLFEVIEKMYFPTIATYSAVIRAAFNNGECKLGWSLMEEMQIRRMVVPDEVYICILETNQNSTDANLTKILEFMSKFYIKPSMQLSGIFKRTFEGNGKGRRGTYTSVLRIGVCKCCQSNLEPARVSIEDYEELKTAFLNPVLIGKDIFQKTRPEEFNRFLSFLENAAPFDVVLDGLNIAFKNRNHKISSDSFGFQLKSVVEHFVSMKKKVLVLGRNHMTKWRAEDMRIVYDNADVFLAEDMSQDDPFLLYATLYSGLGTRFVSQDMMRSHKFLLANTKLQTTFQLWQAQHQYFIHYIDDYGRVFFRDPVPFVQNIQRNHSGDWHIPYVRKEDLTSKSIVDNFHRHWLCLTNQPQLQADLHHVAGLGLISVRNYLMNNFAITTRQRNKTFLQEIQELINVTGLIVHLLGFQLKLNQ